MIKYSEKDKDKLISFSLSSFGVESSDYNERWNHFSPVNMESSNQFGLKVNSNYETDNHSWMMFNHEEGYYADFGDLNNNSNLKQIYLEFSEKKNIYAIKFNLNDAQGRLAVSLSASLDGKIYEEAGKYDLCHHDNTSLDNRFIYCQHDLTGNYFNGSPTVFVRFDNERYYKYYKISFIYINSQTHVKVSKMFLYDKNNIFYPMIKYPFSNNFNEVNGYNEVIQTENASFQNNALTINHGFVKVNPLFNSKSLTFSFLAKINENNDIQGTLMSVENNILNIDFNTESDFITFQSLYDNSYIGLSCVDLYGEQKTDAYLDDLYYSIDNGQFVKYEFGNNMINVKRNHKISFFKISDGFNSDYDRFHFNMTGQFVLSGKLMSLSGFKNTLNYDHQFCNLFYNCDSLVDVSMLQFPNNTRRYCYEKMFYGCTGITISPYLCASQTNSYCYERMFYGCSNLNKVILNAVYMNGYGFTGQWLYGTSSSGIIYKNDQMTNIQIPSNWSVSQLNQQNIPVYQEGDKYVFCMIKSKNGEAFDVICLLKMNLNNIWHRYTFVFTQNNQKFYFDDQIKYDIDKPTYLNSGENRIVFGKDSNNNYMTKFYLRSLSFYNFENTILNVEKQIN